MMTKSSASVRPFAWEGEAAGKSIVYLYKSISRFWQPVFQHTKPIFLVASYFF